MTDYPKYVVLHGAGSKHLILERCYNENCYTRVAEFDNLFKARELAERLNKTVKG